MAELDGRKKAGAETRRRLIEATADALAAGGVRGVSLRAVSVAAEANVAAVKYHFGSREALISEVLADAMGQVFGAQALLLDELEARPGGVTVREWVEAWARPFLDVMVPTTPRQRRLARIVGRALDGEAQPAGGVGALAAETDARLVSGLAGMLDVEEADLWLRLAVMVSAMAGLSTGTFEGLLQRADADRRLDERLLDILEIIAGGVGAAPSLR